MRIKRGRGLRTVLGLGPSLAISTAARPEGLLLQEPLVYSLVPLHVGMRQYWRDFASLERWARSAPHREWWRRWVRDSGGTGLWHEVYFMGRGMETVYNEMVKTTGFLATVAGNQSPVVSNQ